VLYNWLLLFVMMLVRNNCFFVVPWWLLQVFEFWLHPDK
jgi:hypothetical protein